MSLKQLNLEGQDRVEVAIMRLQHFEPPEGYQLAFSGGKDSVVIYDLAIRAGVRFHAFYNWTGIDPPELYRFVKDRYPDVEIRRPKKSMWRLIEEHQILPTRLVRFCCEYLKEQGNKEGYLITGIRWAESAKRRKRSMVEIGAYNKRIIFLHPIIDWGNDDVWEYIKEYRVPYCSLYDKGFKRLGCIMCPFCRGKQLKMEMERYPKYVDMWRRACERLLITQSHPKYKTGEEMFQWWIAREHVKAVDDCQARFI